MLFQDKRTNTIIISIIWGFGVAALFRKVCDDKNCIVIKAPSDVDTYHQTTKKNCYNFTKEQVDC